MASNSDVVLKLLAVAVIVAVVLQVAFYFLFKEIGYDSFLLSITLTITLLAVFAVVLFWRWLKRNLA